MNGITQPVTKDFWWMLVPGAKSPVLFIQGLEKYRLEFRPKLNVWDVIEKDAQQMGYRLFSARVARVDTLLDAVAWVKGRGSLRIVYSDCGKPECVDQPICKDCVYGVHRYGREYPSR